MAYGGGTWTEQNKPLPGSYINFVKASDLALNNNGRGVVAIPYALNKEAGAVIEITAQEFDTDATTILGFAKDTESAKPFREIFKHATKCIIYDLGENKTATQAVNALEPYEFNILAVYTETAADVSTYITAVETWRDAGIKRQAVVYNATAPDHEGVINVCTTVIKPTGSTIPDHALVAWVAGAEAGCAINASVSNMIYDGEYTVDTSITQTELVSARAAGKFVFHLVYGDARVFEDINSLTTFTTKSEELKYNQTIRVIDGIANDIAKTFNTKYIGQIPNNAAGRASFWADVEKYMRNLETLSAIEPFDSSTLTVERGESRKAIVVNMEVTCINALEQLYLTCVVN